MEEIMLKAGTAAVIVGNARAAKFEVDAWFTGGGCAVPILKLK